VLAVCTFPYTGTNSINSSLINGTIKGKVIPVISEVWSIKWRKHMAVWRYTSTHF